jgi:uncharacterized protein with FMN-binding domain
MPNPFAKHNLVALGAAAVLSVYAAGFERTREAARRFEDADGADRRRPAPVPTTGEIGAPVRTATVEQRAVHGPTATAVGRTPEIATDAHAKSTDAAPSQKVVAIDSTHPADTAHVITAPSPAVIDSTAIKAAAQAAADSAAQTERTRAQFKDGTYYGWGTSRHGDIQAGVEVRDGKIYDAWIQQCLTRYPCSWISMLPSQVVGRQSPDVDFVSGATQSTNAFYYGVVQALTRAK